MLAIIQARYGSKRLPGKILRELAGKPLLAWTVQRLRTSSLCSEVAVATSVDPRDDPTEDFCNKYEVLCFRGPLKNVAKRFAQVASRLQVSAFIRISGDSPMIDPKLVDQAITQFREGQYDLVTNVQKRSFPKGQSVEVLSVDTFKGVLEILQDPYDKEHVTSFYYKNPAMFGILNFESGEDLGNVQLSVDTEEDFSFMERLMERTTPTSVTWQDLVAELRAIKNVDGFTQRIKHQKS